MLTRPAGPHCHPWGALRRNATRRWSPMPTFLKSIILAGVLAAVANPAAAQIPRLKKLKDAAKKVARPADTAQVKPADNTAAGPAVKPDPKVWENYDFVPGNKVIFFTDFSDDKVGNFARRLKYKSGPVEVVERDGAKVLRATGRAEFLIPVGRKLPERFTLEMDLIAPQPKD